MDQSALIQSQIESARHGELESFNSLVLHYQNRLYNTATGILRDEDAAADAVQNAFIQAFRNLNHFRGGSFESWLFRILKNICYDELRRQKRQYTLALEPVDEDGDEFETPPYLTDITQDPAGQLEEKELAQIISRGLQKLPPDYRLALILVDIDGLGYAEAAEVACVPIGTVKSRLARARLRLCDELRRTAGVLPEVFYHSRSSLRTEIFAGV